MNKKTQRGQSLLKIHTLRLKLQQRSIINSALREGHTELLNVHILFLLQIKTLTQSNQVMLLLLFMWRC